jgi:hypothetical protein
VIAVITLRTATWLSTPQCFLRKVSTTCRSEGRKSTLT